MANLSPREYKYAKKKENIPGEQLSGKGLFLLENMSVEPGFCRPWRLTSTCL